MKLLALQGTKFLAENISLKQSFRALQRIWAQFEGKLQEGAEYISFTTDMCSSDINIRQVTLECLKCPTMDLQTDSKTFIIHCESSPSLTTSCRE